MIGLFHSSYIHVLEIYYLPFSQPKIDFLELIDNMEV